MRQRMDLLGTEVAAHRETVNELLEEASTLQQRQAGLLERSHKAMELHRNLSERAGV